MEIWKDIKDYENIYQISNLGRVKRLERKVIDTLKRIYTYPEKILTGDHSKSDYTKITLVKNRKNKVFRIHRLVAITFIPNLENKREVNHKDGNKLNNNIANLEWVSPSENIRHAFNAGLSTQKGSKNNFSKLTEDQVKEIFKLAATSKFTQTEIAKKFKISRTTVSDIKNKKRWGYLFN